MKFLTTFISSLLIGALLSLYTLQQSNHFKLVTEHKLTAIFEQMFACKAQCSLTEFNFFELLMQAQNISVQAPDKKAWVWQAEQFCFNSSWLSFLTTGKFEFSININNAKACTEITDGYPAIFDHVKTMIFDATDLPFLFKNLSITNGLFKFNTPQKSLEGAYNLTTEFRTIADKLKASVYVQKGFLVWRQQSIFENLNMRIFIEKSKEQALPTIRLDGTVKVPFLPENDQICYIDGNYTENGGDIFIRNKSHQFFIHIVHNIEKNELTLKTSCLLDCLQYFLPTIKNLTGVGNYSCTIHDLFGAQSVETSLMLQDINYQGYTCDALNLVGTGDSKKLNGSVTIEHVGQHRAIGTWSFDKGSEIFSANLSNNATMLLNNDKTLLINPHQAQLILTVKNGVPHIAHTIEIENKCQTRNIVHTGSIIYADELITAQGSINNHTYLMCFDAQTQQLTKGTCLDEKGEAVIKTERIAATNDLQIIIDASLLQILALYWLNVDIRSYGKIKVSSTYKESHIRLNVSTDDLNLTASNLYNFIKSITGQLYIDINNKSMHIEDARILLYKGEICCQRGIVMYAAAHKSTFIHVPLIIKEVLANYEKDILALISGSLLLYSKNDQLACKGTVYIDHSDCKINILSAIAAYQNQSALPIALPTMPLNITIKTRAPLSIKTAFLNTEAIGTIDLQRTINDAQISGNVSLSGGVLKFPYKPLYISHCHIAIAPNQLSNSVIDFVAKGTVKKYHITLRIVGPIGQPHIILESNPNLTEEQILLLLLTGAEQGSLVTAVPTIIMQNLRQLLFNTDQSPSSLEYYFNNFLGPLRRIRIAPSFSDQTGRGGFRGAIEVEVSDRLNALIQRNFSLSEDTKFEVEYLMSDDITLRGIKDERGDLGGEIEMRWKF